MSDLEPVSTDFYFTADVLELLGLKTKTGLWLAVRNGRFPPPKRMGRFNVWKKTTIRAWREALVEDENPEPTASERRRRQAAVSS